MRRKEFVLLVGPSAVIMIGLLVFPLFQTVVWSLQKVTYGTPGTFIGLDNFTGILGDSRFREAVLFTVGLTLTGLVLKLVCGFLIAVLLQRVGRLRPMFLGFLLLSYIVPTVIGATAFSWLFDSNFGGLINWILQHVGVSDPPLWFADQWPNRLMILGNIVWHELPFSILILLAGLQGINTESIEAAQIDGANWFQQQRYVVIPALGPLLGFISLITIMDGLRVFDALVPLAPSAVSLHNESIMIYVYNIAFAAGTQNLGVGSAVSVITMVIIAILLVPFIRQTYREARGA
ncbi:Binding-protein-dependent transport systems inner membrane component [Nostocoides japonicum T1-X7]|uniref:Binding-protein-dependent transport systems inner membrane component n=1 Tax=Nostocoides japonicum T1-X7 TaxID=1194083 RepID=A0A077LWK3_9MICO|nr:sugar ABC transporter permease [Tetrasphaera japonica]CCH76305.1 Binding-protein-dependent transport systems inner membrane component [Tetrasphaera japonica T1-X7]